MKIIDRSDDPLVHALTAIINKYAEMEPINEDDVLEALAYVYACVQRDASGKHPDKLN